MTVYFSKNGTRIEISQFIGKGGEGDVYEVSGKPSTVAKILKMKKRTRERERNTRNYGSTTTRSGLHENESTPFLRLLASD